MYTLYCDIISYMANIISYTVVLSISKDGSVLI